MVHISSSVEDTVEFAAEFLAKYRTSNIIGLIGELGSGKTTFVQAIAKTLGITETVKSPTFLILKSYLIPQHNEFEKLIHIDWYRLDEGDGIEAFDLPTLWQDQKILTIIEWADRIESDLPVNTQLIYFEHLGENQRQITIKEKSD